MAQFPKYEATAAASSLHNGDCMSQLEFNKLYEKMPGGFQAELIEGCLRQRAGRTRARRPGCSPVLGS